MNAAEAGSSFRKGVTRTHRALAALENLLALLGGLAVVLATVLGVAEILGRAIFNIHVPGAIDLIEYLAAIFAFAALAYCQRQGGHVGMDLLTGRLSTRGKHWAGLFDTAVGMFFIAVLITASWSHFQRAFYLGDSSMDIGLPMWPAKLLIPIAFAFWLLRLLLQAIGYILAITGGEAKSELIPADPHAQPETAKAESPA